MERSIIVSLLLIYVFLRFPSGKRKWNQSFSWFFAIDLLLVFLAIATEIYTIWGSQVSSTERITIQLFGNAVKVDYIVGWIVVGMVLDATRRSFGWAIVSLCLAFIGYSLVASYFPGPLKGATATWTYLAYALYVTDQGVYGIGADVLLTMLFVFLLFASMLVGTRLGAFFTAAANAVVGRYSGGPAKVAVVASALVATISGSGVANVAITGCVTIPLMKRMGYQPAFAGAVEAVASSGGYFTPPVMGAAAFLIAVFTNTPYFMVCVYTAVPAFLYFLAVLVQVHLRAKRDRLVGLPDAMIPSLARVMLEGWHLVVPLMILVAGLALGYSVNLVSTWAILAIIAVSFLRKETRQSPRRLLLLLESTAVTTIGILMCVVSVGIIQGALMTTGLGMRLSFIVEALCRGNLVLGLILAAFVTMILGMGVNPLLVYYIAHLFIIPALIKAGAPVMSAHIFALIYGGIANITPPVALASYTAATIAGASATKTGFEGVKLGFAAYIVPFLIVLHPDLLLLNGVTLEAVLSLLTATAGVACMGAAFEGWLLHKTPIWQRIALFIGGICLIAPQLYLAGVGIGLLLLVMLCQKFRPEPAVLTRHR